ncbi:MAG: AI-2E family transporter YdiK [Gammaproteobacteria bacterium]|nr:AI-2E family transporter YdiK [Gammaproteobacteria bacterium]MBU1602663.1 AI-2E family transporter YdiK [Gammaproteobacteria bacterium]MBU2433468.1 AI-2E family transporter YdiK [Gammaproteobacteria bacterium]MBU2451384.1 AI-2E family transporter YdiK [Gammaproteobacteria bacterium]
MTEIRRDLARNTLAILCILGLIGLSLWVLLPFLAATVWAVMIVVATWPLFRSLEVRLGNRRGPAVAIMSLAMLLLLVLPLWLAIDTIFDHSEQLTVAGKSFAANGLPQPPTWVKTVPLVGERIAAGWAQLDAAGTTGIVAKITPYAADTGKWVLAQVGDVGGMLIQFLLVVTIAAILYSGGEAGARLARRFGRRLAGERGENSIILAGQAIRGVALGVGVTAIVQTVLGGLGLAVAGVPFASLLSAVMLMLCIAQIGPMLIMLPAVGWMYWMGDTGWATALLVWSVIVGSLDNFLRPMLIKRGADLPLLLIFAGVIGGMLSFGLIGIFVGPVVLAVTYTLTLAWIEDALGKDEPELPPEPQPSELPEPDHPEPAASQG